MKDGDVNCSLCRIERISSPTTPTTRSAVSLRVILTVQFLINSQQQLKVHEIQTQIHLLMHKSVPFSLYSNNGVWPRLMQTRVYEYRRRRNNRSNMARFHTRKPSLSIVTFYTIFIFAFSISIFILYVRTFNADQDQPQTYQVRTPLFLLPFFHIIKF
jgi:hypothetical protein